MSDILESALKLARLGYNVFPSNNGIPAITSWPDRATTDKNQIEEWWSADVPLNQQRFNQISVCPKSTCVVIDIDVKKGKQGKKSLKYLIDNFNLNANTMAVKTKSGGLHLYYAWPPDVEYIKSVTGWTVAGRGLDGIDIRGNRGQVRAPTGDGEYIVINELSVDELLPLPDELIKYLPADKPGGLRVDGSDGKNLTVKKSPLRGELPNKIPRGERHDTLLSLTASWSRTTSYSNAKVLLEEAINRCEGDDISVDDYMSRLDSAYKKYDSVTSDAQAEILKELVYVESTGGVYNTQTRRHSPMSKAVNQYANRTDLVEVENAKGEVKSKVVNLFDQWRKSKKRVEVITLGYRPTALEIYNSRELGGLVANTYIKPIAEPNDGNCDWFEELVRFLWQDQADNIFNWLAHIVQKPTIKVNWAPVLISTFEGMGKNLFFTIMSHVLGCMNTTDVRAASFKTQFNSFLLGNQLILINELQSVSKRDASNLVETLKSYITEDVQSVEAKGQDAYKIEVYCNFIIFSNKIDCIDLQDTSRRFHIHINYDKPKSPDYYVNLWNNFMTEDHSVKTEAIGAVRGWLERRDISQFNHGEAAVSTASKEVVINANKTLAEDLIEEDIRYSRSIFKSDIVSRSSFTYYIRYVMPGGFKLSHAHQKFLFKKYAIPIRLVKRDKGTPLRREFNSCHEVSSLSDETGIIKGEKVRMDLYSVRNHGIYETKTELVDIKIIRDEYNKTFNESGGNLSIVK